MKTLLTSIALIAAIGCSSAAFAAEESHDLATKTEHAVAGGHFPVIKPRSRAGPLPDLSANTTRASCSAVSRSIRKSAPPAIR